MFDPIMISILIQENGLMTDMWKMGFRYEYLW